jgi:methyl-accepting chemotaxis protein
MFEQFPETMNDRPFGKDTIMRMTLRKKVLGLIIVSVSATAVVTTSLSIMNIISRGNMRAASFKETLLTERKQQIKGYVDMAVGILDKVPRDEAKKIVRNMRYGDKGYIWIHDFKNIVVVHDDPRVVGKDMTNLQDPNGVRFVRELTRICRDKGEGYLSYAWKIPGQETLRPKIAFARAMPGADWVVATGLYIDDIDAEAAKERARIRREVISTIAQHLAVSLAVSILLMVLAIYIVNRHITGPLEAITRAIENFDNDLTLTLPVAATDEVGELAGWLNDLIGKFHQVIVMISEVTGKIHSHSGVIASTMDQQMGFATQLSSSVVEISSSMEELSSTASQIAQHSHGVVERADRALVDTRHGAGEVEVLSVKMNDISNDIQSNLNEIVELGRKSKEINKIMEIINTIASRTKLIAFNAALEAASAGEAGKRFGVVAVEIRRLADSVVESTGEIEGKINEILDAVNRLVMSSEKNYRMATEGREYASVTVSMLIESVDGAEETAGAARQISLSTQQQQIASSQVLAALKEIEQGVLHSTDSVHTLNRVTGELAGLSDRLKSLVTTFKLGDGVSPDTGGGE